MLAPHGAFGYRVVAQVRSTTRTNYHAEFCSLAILRNQHGISALPLRHAESVSPWDFTKDVHLQIHRIRFTMEIDPVGANTVFIFFGLEPSV